MNAIARLYVKSRFPSLHFLKPGRFVVGRHSTSDLILDIAEISRQHALIEIEPPRNVTLVDLGSRNGIRVNGQTVDRVALLSDAVIEFGTVVGVFEFLTNEQFTDDEPTPSVAAKEDFKPKLSPAVERVLVTLLNGLSVKAIAKKLSISPHTVHNHVKHIYNSYQVNSRSELLAYFLTRPDEFLQLQ